MPFYLMWVEEITVLVVALLALGVVLILVRRSSLVAPDQTITGRISALVAASGVVVFWLTRLWFSFPTDATWRFSLPLAAATLAIAFYAVSTGRPRRPGVSSEVDLSPRSVWTFGRRWWFAGFLTLSGLLAVTVVLAGLASSVDDQGQYTMIVIDVGNAQAGTLFFGWAFGIPVLVALVLLLVSVFLALWWLSRPSVAADPQRREDEFARRRNQTRTVLALSSGATAFSLGAALALIARSSTLAASLPSPDGVPINLVTSFAALGTPFTIAGILLQGVGVALVLFCVFQPGTARSSAADAYSSTTAGSTSR